MKQSVTIKGHKLDATTVGLTVLLDETLSFPLLLEDIAIQFQESGRFFRNAKILLSLEGRSLTAEEQNQIIQTIQANAPIRIDYIVDNSDGSGSTFERVWEHVEAAEYVSDEDLCVGKFYRGTLRDGQRLEVEGNITILGDVMSGARVVAGGSVIVIGSLKGSVVAGTTGCDAYIVATDLLPVRLRIGEYAIDGKDVAFSGYRGQPMIVHIQNQEIIIERVSDCDVANL